MPLLVEADRAWTVWLSKPITERFRSCKPEDPTVEGCSAKTITIQSTTMKFQEYSERCVTSTGVLIASFLYIFLFVSAALYIPLPGAYNGSNVLSLLDSHMLVRRNLRGQPVYINTTAAMFTNSSALDLRQTPRVQVFSASPNEVKTPGISAEDLNTSALSLADSGKELSTEDTSSASTDDWEQETYSQLEGPYDVSIFKTKAKSIRQSTPGFEAALRLGFVSYVVIAGIILMSFR